MAEPDAGRGARPDAAVTKQARQAVEQAEAGDTGGRERLQQARKADPAGAEAAKQEASDGPKGRGLSR
jgi:hypothetical protein